MTFSEMESACNGSLAASRVLGLDEKNSNVTLVTPKGWKPPPKFPRGYLLQVKDNGDRLWHFKSARVLAWLRAAVLKGGDQ